MKEGYKQTELGLIPKDWEVKRFGDIGPVKMCRRIFADETSSLGDIPFYKIGTFGSKPDAYISREKFEYYKRKYPFPKVGDILISAAGTIGRTVVFDGSDSYFQDSNIVWIENDEKLVINQFLNLILLKSNFTTEGGTLKRLYNNILLSTKFASPPIDEQNAIANCLSTWDEAIEKQQKLIDAKEIRHKALMQKLLSGKKRLPGFTEEWKEVKLGDLLEFKKGSGLSKDLLTESGQPCILYGELFTKYREVISEVLSFTESSTNVVSKTGDILLPGSTTTTGIDLAKASVILKSNVYLGGDINILRPKATLNSTFVSYLLNYEYKYQISAMAQGITIIHLYGKDLKHIKICLPATKEQDYIVEILENSIKEILIESKNVDQLKQQKKSLMQKLLTGKVRLPLSN